jgi:DNA-binding LacI/PurR family transcriptional regulator
MPLLKQIGVPIVLINSQQPGPYIYSVAVDNVQGGQLATSHLISQGHRRIGYLGGPPDHSSNLDRMNGYMHALADAQLPFDAALVQHGNGRADSGELVGPLLSQSKPPTAIFCYNDWTAIGAMHALKRRGLRVPEDVSVIGFDNIEFAMYVDPPLTTIHQPKVEMGRRAMTMLIDLLQGKNVTNFMAPGELVVRSSTRPLGRPESPSSPGLPSPESQARWGSLRKTNLNEVKHESTGAGCPMGPASRLPRERMGETNRQGHYRVERLATSQARS